MQLYTDFVSVLVAGQGASPAALIPAHAGGMPTFPAWTANPLWRWMAWWIEWPRFVAEHGREPTHLEEYVDWSQRCQAEGLALGAAVSRARFPQCGGLLVWIGHDAFPCPANPSHARRTPPLGRILRPGRRADMTPQQYWLLGHLQHHGPTSISELATALGITAGSATVACQRLEKAALLTRMRQAHDERVVQVALTEQGQSRIADWRQRRHAAVTHLLRVLDLGEQAELHRLLERLLAAADAQGFEEQMVTLTGNLPINDERTGGAPVASTVAS